LYGEEFVEEDEDAEPKQDVSFFVVFY